MVTERVTYGTEDIVRTDDINQTFWIKKTLVSSAILTTGVDVTGVSSVGELVVENIIVKTDATGLATGTNLEIASDNTNGLANIFVTVISGLGANKTVDLNAASVTKIQTVLEVGKKLTAVSTGLDSTGAGTVDIYIQFRRLADKATIAAA